MAVSFYIHIPFCSQKCSYCDFTGGYPSKPEAVERYTAALIQEFRLLSNTYPDKKDIKTLYFGGGTPSILGPSHLEPVFKVLDDYFNLNSLETTIEANPEDVTADKASLWKAMGINRVSLGFQSMQESTLRFLGRHNKPETNRKSFQTLREAGFDNISVDWISCVGDEDVNITLSALKELHPDHISVYQLTIAEKTLLYQKYRRNEYTPLSPEAAMAQYWNIADALTAEGYEHYEISNFSKSKHSQSRHNKAYWNYDEYLAAGLGASAFLKTSVTGLEGKRWTNTTSLKDYFAALEAGKLPPAETELIDYDTALREYIMVGLRLLDGIHFDRFQSTFGQELPQLLDRKKLTEISDFIVMDNSGIRLSRQGVGVSNRVISMLWDALS